MTSTLNNSQAKFKGITSNKALGRTNRRSKNFTKKEKYSGNNSPWQDGECVNAKSNSPSKLPILSILDRSVARSGLQYDSFVRALINTALSRLLIWDQTDLDRLLLAAERLGLDPLCGEIYALEPKTLVESEQNLIKASGKKGVVIVVSLDGWSRIINTHPQFDGMRLLESGPGHDELPLYFECTIFRKDRKVATSVREYMHEAHTGHGAWLTHPRRMLRHKAMVQCARICFGLAGIYDPDEAQRVTIAISKESSKNVCVPIFSHSTSSNHGATESQKYGPDIEKCGMSSQSKKGTQFVKNWVMMKQT